MGQNEFQAGLSQWGNETHAEMVEGSDAATVRDWFLSEAYRGGANPRFGVRQEP